MMVLVSGQVLTFIALSAKRIFTWWKDSPSGCCTRRQGYFSFLYWMYQSLQFSGAGEASLASRSNSSFPKMVSFSALLCTESRCVCIFASKSSSKSSESWSTIRKFCLRVEKAYYWKSDRMRLLIFFSLMSEIQRMLELLPHLLK